MATLSVNFIRQSEDSERQIVKSLYLVGRRIRSVEKIENYECAYLCRETKMHPQCWVISHKGVWRIFSDLCLMQVGRFDYLEVTIK